MNKRLINTFALLSLIVIIVSAEALSESNEDKNLTELYDNILIGELFPSENVYLERFSLDGGHDNQQHFDGLNFSEQIEIYPIKKTTWDVVQASFNRLIQAIYIGESEKNSSYFSYPFSKARQDALLYKVNKKITDTPVTVVSINTYKIENIIYFDGSAKREYSHIEYEAAMQQIRDDHGLKDKYDATLSKINMANTILNAKKIALLRLKNVSYEVLLSVYNTHGFEYTSTVYIVDIIDRGKIILTKEKYNIDGPY